jgi:hypothetical protein
MIQDILRILEELTKALNATRSLAAGGALDELVAFFRSLAQLVSELVLMLEGLRWASNALLDLLLHFLYSGVAGLLAYYSIYWTTRWLSERAACRSRGGIWLAAQVDRCIGPLSWSAAVFSSLLAHIWWDGLL